MKFIVLLLYAVSAFCSMAISYMIAKSNNGGLKKALLFLFLAITFALGARFISGWFNLNRDLTSLILMIPFTLAIIWFSIYLYIYHKK